MATESQEVWTLVGQAAVGIVVAAGYIANHFKGRKRDKGRSDEQEQLVEKIGERFEKRITTFQDRVDRRLDTLDAGVAEVRAFCVGPDGKNGFRKDIDEIKASGERVTQRLDGFDERERARLEKELDHARFDRRAS